MRDMMREDSTRMHACSWTSVMCSWHEVCVADTCYVQQLPRFVQQLPRVTYSRWHAVCAAADTFCVHLDHTLCVSGRLRRAAGPREMRA